MSRRILLWEASSSTTIPASRRHARASGIEWRRACACAGRAARARDRLEATGGSVIPGDLFALDVPWQGPRWTLALMMPGRFLEAPPDAAARLRARLDARCDRTIAYAYGDWLTRFGGLDALAAAAGLRLEAPDLDTASGYPLWRTCALCQWR